MDSLILKLTIMADQNNPHFKEIFWFIVLTTICVLGYCTAVSFINVPEKNMRVVDTITGFLLGTVLSSGIGYLLGGNPTAPHTPINKIDNVEQLDSKTEINNNKSPEQGS